MTQSEQRRRPTILVPVDDSEASRAAAGVAADQARADGSELLLVTIGPLPETSAQRDEALETLGRRLARIGQQLGGVTVRQRVSLAGDPLRGILEVAEEEGVERIVIAHHDRAPVDGLFDASVAAQVQDRAGVPVTIVSP